MLNYCVLCYRVEVIMAIVDVVKYNGNPNIMAWKYPNEELRTWTQVIVNETQEEEKQTKVVKCKECGAKNTIVIGETKECEYCGSLLQ